MTKAAAMRVIPNQAKKPSYRKRINALEEALQELASLRQTDSRQIAQLTVDSMVLARVVMEDSQRPWWRRRPRLTKEYLLQRKVQLVKELKAEEKRRKEVAEAAEKSPAPPVGGAPETATAAGAEQATTG